MVQLEHNILIKTDPQVVWAFITDIQHSQCLNRFHSRLELPDGFRMKTGTTYIVHHQLAFSSYPMRARVVQFEPPHLICIREELTNAKQSGFEHTCTFHIVPEEYGSNLVYQVEGTFGSRLKDVPFKPLLSGVMVEELIRIKQAVESSQTPPMPLHPQNVHSI
jgi:carbon monoxide dehydrogenase subunit G